MTGEWDSGRLDLDDYLARIGYAGNPDPTEKALYAMHRAHVAAIPFENLDIPLGRGVSTDLGAVQAKLVGRRRGGYCYEHGLLFAAVLDRVGYSVTRLLARVGDDPARPRPRSHMTLHVRAGDRQWLADVGFGAGLLEPLPWGDTGPHSQGCWTYRLVPRGERAWQMAERRGTAWQPLYGFTEEPQHLSDIEVANYFTSTHPSSPFTGQLVVMRKSDDGHLRLRGRQLTSVRCDGSASERELPDAEVARALREEFALPLTGEEITGLLQTLPR